MSVVTPTITSQGAAIDPAFQLLSIDVIREVNRIPRAHLILRDGDAARQSFAASDAATFEPGKEIEIKLRWEGGKDAPVFKGLVVRHSVEASREETLLIVELRDRAFKLTGARTSAVFRDKSDDEVIGSLIGDAGLQKGTLSKTKPKHPEIVQFNSTDWDFLLSRAEANGLLVLAHDGKVSLEEISLSGSPAHRFEWGLSEIYDFEMEADATHQVAELESVAWDLPNQKPSAPSKADGFDLSQGDLDAAAIARTLGLEKETLTHIVPLQPEEQQAWANGAMQRRRMALLRGRLSVRGISNIVLLDVVEVAGVGGRFNGKTLVTGLRQRVDSDGWRTDVSFGLAAASYPERTPHVVGAAAAGLLPGVSELQIGVVAPFEEDPDKEYRVKVFVPAVDPSEEAIWARLALTDAGSERGMLFRPEAGDEVIVGFVHGDPRSPVILGSLYSSKNAPAEPLAEWKEENLEKGFVTRSGTKLAFIDDEDASVYIETAKGNKILLDDAEEKIELADQHGNTLTLSKDGVVIVSAKDFGIDAPGDIEIKGASVNLK